MREIRPAASEKVRQLIKAFTAFTHENPWTPAMVIDAEALNIRAVPSENSGGQLIIALTEADDLVLVPHAVAASDAKGQTGPDAAATVAHLLMALKDEDARVRAVASRALGKMCPAAADCVPQLIRALKDENAQVRAAASQMLSKIGTAAVDALPQLVIALNDEDAWVRAFASQAWGKIGPAAAADDDVVPNLTIALNHEDARVRAFASQALGRIGPAAAGAVPELLVALRDKHAGVRAAASQALGNIAREDFSIVGAVIKKHISSVDSVDTSSPLLITAVHGHGYDVGSRVVSLLGEDVIDRLAKVDSCDKAHGVLLQRAVSMHAQGGGSLDRILAQAVVHSIWCSRSKDVVRSALEALPEAMQVLQLSALQQHWLAQGALQMRPNEVVEWKLRELLPEPTCNHDSSYQAMNQAQPSDYLNDKFPGLGPVDTDVSFSRLQGSSCKQDNSLERCSGDGVPLAMWARPWSRSSSAALSDSLQTDSD